MPQITAREALADPDFQALPLSERIKAMRAIDPDFAALPEPEQSRALGGATAGPPPGTPGAGYHEHPLSEEEGMALVEKARERGEQEGGARAGEAIVKNAPLVVGSMLLPELISGALGRIALPALLKNPWVAGGAAGAGTYAATGDPATALQVGASVLTGVGGARAAQAAKAAPAVMEAAAASEAAPALVRGIAPGTTKVAAGKIFEWAPKGGWRAIGDAPVVAEAAPVVAEVAPKVVSAVPEIAKRAMKTTAKAAAKAEDAAPIQKQLEATLKLSKGGRAQLSAAQTLEAKVVDFKTRQGLSEPQIVASLKEAFGIREPGAAKEMVDLILRTH